MKVIVTGGAGFIGSALSRILVLEEKVTQLSIIDKMTYASSEASLKEISSHADFELLKHDICDFEAVRDIVADVKPDLIVHLAAESHVDRSITGSREFIETNVIGTYNMLEAARIYWNKLKHPQKDRFRFLHVSTDEVYGSLGSNGLFKETTAYDPSSPYSASKAASDHLAMAWHRTYNLPVVLSNCSNNYGPYQFPEKLIPLMVLNALRADPLPVYGDGLNIRDWLYVDDHARALIKIATKGRVGEKYNVGGKSERTNLQVVESICDIVDELTGSVKSSRELITFVTDRPGHDYRYAIDSTKLETELHWSPRESFESGMAKTVKWYLRNEDWWSEVRKTQYQGERLGLETD